MRGFNYTMRNLNSNLDDKSGAVKAGFICLMLIYADVPVLLNTILNVLFIILVVFSETVFANKRMFMYIISLTFN